LASHHLNFTKAALEKVAPPQKGKRDYYYDQRELNQTGSYAQKLVTALVRRQFEVA